MAIKTTNEFIPATKSLAVLKHAALVCEACPLFRNATQTVFGEGPRRAKLVLIGEVPGDEEDKTGHPFVGAAGRLLDEALHEAAIPRKNVYLTNVVKHFKWEPRGKRRLHAKPNAGEIRVCRTWLDRELEIISPEVIVCLGATASQTMLGREFKVTKHLGEWHANESYNRILSTYHPSAVLRSPDPSTRQTMWQALVRDLKLAYSVI